MGVNTKAYLTTNPYPEEILRVLKKNKSKFKNCSADLELKKYFYNEKEQDNEYITGYIQFEYFSKNEKIWNKKSMFIIVNGMEHEINENITLTKKYTLLDLYQNEENVEILMHITKYFDGYVIKNDCGDLESPDNVFERKAKLKVPSDIIKQENTIPEKMNKIPDIQFSI